MNAKMTKIGSKSSGTSYPVTWNGGVTPKRKIVFYNTNDGDLNVLEVPDNIELKDVKNVRLKISEGNYQMCKVIERPNFMTLYTMVNGNIKGIPWEEISDIETALKKQLNLGTYEFTIDALQIAGA